MSTQNGTANPKIIRDETIMLEISEKLHERLQALKSGDDDNIIDTLRRLVNSAHDRKERMSAWRALQESVHAAGGLDVGETTEEIVETMRKTRQEIFDAEYAHLYR